MSPVRVGTLLAPCLQKIGVEVVSALSIETAISGFLASAAIIVFLARFGKPLFWAAVALAVLLLDQVTKALAGRLPAGPIPGTLGLLQFAPTQNHLQGFGGTAQGLIFPLLTALAASALLYRWLVQTKYVMTRWSQFSLALVAGAITSIAADRLAQGSTPDFIGFANGAFLYNFADLAAILGCAMLSARAVGLVASSLASKTDPWGLAAARLRD